jgi:hypothetical protein
MNARLHGAVSVGEPGSLDEIAEGISQVAGEEGRHPAGRAGAQSSHPGLRRASIPTRFAV